MNDIYSSRDIMAFVKHGDGKITTILTDDELTEQQKKSVKDLSKKSDLEDDGKKSLNGNK